MFTCRTGRFVFFGMVLIFEFIKKVKHIVRLCFLSLFSLDRLKECFFGSSNILVDVPV